MILREIGISCMNDFAFSRDRCFFLGEIAQND